MSKDKRITVTMSDRLLGTASGWDGSSGEYIWYYDFIPACGVNLPSGCLNFEIDKGWLYVQDEDQNQISPKHDLPSFLVVLPRKPSQ